MRENKMMSIETRVNGKLIQVVEIKNCQSEFKETSKYHVRYFSFGEEPEVYGFELKHKVNQGAEVLISHVYREIAKIKGGVV